jgi:hypothetical protein
MFLKIHIFASLRAIYTKLQNFTIINMTHLPLTRDSYELINLWLSSMIELEFKNVEIDGI